MVPWIERDTTAHVVTRKVLPGDNFALGPVPTNDRSRSAQSTFPRIWVARDANNELVVAVEASSHFRPQHSTKVDPYEAGD